MPPQQSDRLLDLVDNRLDFGAHGYTRETESRGDPNGRSGERQAARTVDRNLETHSRDARGDSLGQKDAVPRRESDRLPALHAGRADASDDHARGPQAAWGPCRDARRGSRADPQHDRLWLELR